MTIPSPSRYALMHPSQLVRPPAPRPAIRPMPLLAPSQLFGHDRPALAHPSALRGLVPPANILGQDGQLQFRQIQAAQTAVKEWQSGVRESRGPNLGPRIDQYARNSQFGPGHAWCGFFSAFALTQAGFTQSPYLASYQKARDFFLYRSYTDHSPAKNQALDTLRAQHQAQGSQRQYFLLPESPNHEHIQDYGQLYRHFNPAAHTYAYQALPIRPGDIALFDKGHVGMVLTYDRTSGKLVTIEGNTSGQGPDGRTWHQAVVRKEYDLSRAETRKIFAGFGRPALGDFR